jgi:DNA-binding Lrp family transcriptional regulator
MTKNNEIDELTELQKKLLNEVQWNFPLTNKPWEVLAERLDCTPAEIMEDLRVVKEKNILRQLSAIFDTKALGYSSALIAAKLDPEKIDEGAAEISKHPGVSHNYKRNNDYNLWYTLAVPPHEDFDEHLDYLHNASGSLVTRKLPTLKLYKIGVKLDMTGTTAPDAKAEVLAHEAPVRSEEPPELSDLDYAVIKEAQEDLPLVDRPFMALAAEIGCSEDDILSTLESLKERKLMRRFAAVMNHRKAGYKANAMGVWAVPEKNSEEIGPKMAGFAFVSHCYKRPTYDDWPYSIFTMVHGHNAQQCEDTIAAIKDETGIKDYTLLWSVKEYKKTRVKYFTPDWDIWRQKMTGETASN